MLNPKLESALYCVQKPGRYVGGEKNSVIKDKTVDIRFAILTYTRSGCRT